VASEHTQCRCTGSGACEFKLTWMR